MSTMTEEELANLSDDEIMNMSVAPELPAEDPVVLEEPTGSEEEPEPVATPEEEPKDVATAPEDDDGSGSDGSEDVPDAGAVVETPPGDAGEHQAAVGDGAKPEESPKVEEDPENKTPETVDYEAAYNQIMAPFKANGKEVKLQSPEEAVRLMQMGANYTKKLQALQPNLKLLKMMENNDLLDEGKLSFLIDVSKKDPAAIQKLVRESGVDPMDIDTSVEPDYKPGNHSVPDAEIAFTTVLEEVASDPEGKDMILTINKTWDDKSKQALWDDPEIVRVMTEQKKNGLYDQISTELERRRMLGHHQNDPFLLAYKKVGEELQAKGLLTKKPSAADPGDTPTPPRNRVLETRPAQRKKVSNTDKAKAASSTKSSAKPAKQDFNPLSLSDEEFEKNYELSKRL